MSERTAHICAAVWLFLACAGCASGQQVERYRAERGELERARASAASAAPDDPFAGATELSRNELIERVLARNPGLDAAREAWQAALARYPQATALADPMFGYGVRPRSFGSDEVDDAQDFELSQALPFPGKRGLRGEMALASADAAGEDVAAERVRLAALASTLFDAYWLAERALETNAQHLVLLEELRAAALTRYAAGTSSRESVLAAETEHAMLLHSEIELAAERRIVVERINTLLHRAPELPLPPPPRALEASTGARPRRVGACRGAPSSSDRSCARAMRRSARARPTSPWRGASSCPTSRCAARTRAPGRRRSCGRSSGSS